MKSWFNKNQSITAEMNGLMAGVYAKMPLQLARISLIIHCLNYPDDPSSQQISAETMALAIELTEYFRG